MSGSRDDEDDDDGYHDACEDEEVDNGWPAEAVAALCCALPCAAVACR